MFQVVWARVRTAERNELSRGQLSAASLHSNSVVLDCPGSLSQNFKLPFQSLFHFEGAVLEADGQCAWGQLPLAELSVIQNNSRLDHDGEVGGEPPPVVVEVFGFSGTQPCSSSD